MKLKLKQKIFSIYRQQYQILDTDENLAFYIKPLFSFFPKYEIRDKDENLLYSVKQRMFRVLKRFDIYDENKQHVYTVKQKFSPFVPKAKILSLKDNEKLEVKGNILAHEFDICHGDEIKASISKKYISLTDSYVLDINDEINAGLYIAITMIYDAIYFSDHRRGLFR